MDTPVGGRVAGKQPPVTALQPAPVRREAAGLLCLPGLRKVGQDTAQFAEGLGVQRRGEPPVQFRRIRHDVPPSSLSR